MAKFIGRLQELGIAKEATRGTLVAPTIWVPKTDFSVEDKATKARVASSYGRIVGGDDALVSEIMAQGDLTMEVQDKTIALIMYAVFGSLSSASFNGAYKHTLSILNSVQHPSLSLFMNDPIGAAESPTKSIAYARAMVDQFELTSLQGGLVTAKVGFIAAAHKDFTRQTPSYAGENKFTSKHVTIKVASNVTGLDAASAVNVQELTLTVKKNVIMERSLGTVQPVDILNRMLEVSGKLKLTYEDRTYRDYMMNGTKKALRIAIVNDDVSIGSTTNPQVQIDLAVVDFDQWAPAHPNEDLSTQEIMFNALYDVANDRLIGPATFVVNTTASY